MQRAVEVFRALGDETRLRILNLLSEREVCVCEIVDVLKLGQSKISRHLAVLKHAGLVECRRDGMWVFYQLTPARSDMHRQILDWLVAMRHQIAESRRDLQRLGELTEQPQCCSDKAEPEQPSNFAPALGDRQLVC
ncbi:MAG: winged helix-turn-helix domain-containing protein [Pirellulaceae bacterium]|nr:winged helix-turn-helix domain-containing protein [Pirellulaceae bacterium]